MDFILNFNNFTPKNHCYEKNPTIHPILKLCLAPGTK